MRIYKDNTWESIEKKGSQEFDYKGKYLFFSSNRSLIINIAQQEISIYNFNGASELLASDGNKGEYVLCINDSDTQPERELAMRYSKKKASDISAG